MAERSENSKFLKNQGIRCIQLKDIEKARGYLKSALIIDPDDIKVRKLLARVSFILGDEKEAIRLISSHLKQGYFPLSLTLKKLPSGLQLNDVFLETYRFTAFDRKVSYFKSMTERNLGNHPLVFVLSQDRVLFLVPEAKAVIEQPSVLLGGENNYFHWIIRYLPKLQQYLSDPNLQHLPLVVNSDLQPYQKKSLQLLGVSPSRLLGVDQESIYRFSSLFYLNKPTKTNLLYVRERLIPAVFCEEKQRIFLFRGKAHRRNLLNEEEVFTKLEPLGFKKIEPGKLSLEEQIRWFANAEIVVGTHDAGFANLLFAQEGTKVLELTHRNNPMVNFSRLASLTKLSYQNMKGEIDASVNYKSGYYRQMANFTIDADEVVKTVENML